MPSLTQIEKRQEQIKEIYQNRDALITFQEAHYQVYLDDMLLLITNKRLQPGEAYDGRKHKLNLSRKVLLKGLLLMFRLRPDGTPANYAKHYNPNTGFRRVSWQEITQVTGLTRHQFSPGLTEFEQAGIITRSYETIDTGDRPHDILYMRLNGGKLCAIFHQIQEEKRQGTHTPVDRRETTNREIAGGSGGGLVSASAPADQPGDASIRDMEKKAASRALSSVEKSWSDAETPDFEEAITRLQTAFPDDAIKPSTRRHLLRYHHYRQGHQQFNCETATRWLEGWSNEATCPFPVKFKTPEELARFWIYVANEMNRFVLQPLVNICPVQLSVDKEQAQRTLNELAEAALDCIVEPQEVLADHPARVLADFFQLHPYHEIVGRFYLAHAANSPYMQQLIEKHGETLHQALLHRPDYYCLLQAVGIDAKHWTVRPEQFEKDITASLNATMHDQADRTGITQVWGLDRD